MSLWLLGLAAITLFLALDSPTAAAERAAQLKGLSAAQLFNGTNVWTVHLKFTPEQWEAIEPKGGNPGFGGPGNNRGPAGGFGPAMFLAPGFLKGDQDKDQKLSKTEFQSLATNWFGAWDKEKKGALTGEQIVTGLNSVVEFGGFGRPGGGGGGPGGRGPGLRLQGEEGKRNGLASAMGIEFPTVRADLEFAGQPLKDVAVRYKGNGTFVMSRNSPKHSLKIDLNEFVKGQKIGEVSKLNLHNNITDASSMNEVLSHRLYRDAGVPAPKTAYARVFISVPGKHEKKYFGLYSLVENIDTNFAEENFKTKKGAIFKPVTPNLFADLGKDWSRYQQTYDPKTEVTSEQTQRVIEFSQLVSKASDADFNARLGDFLDLDQFARYMAVTTWLSTLDGILAVGQNYYLYLHPKTGKFQFFPWDLDHSFGQFVLIGTQEQRENLNIHRPWSGEKRFLERVFKAEGFKKLYLAKMEEFSKTIFNPERFHQQVDQMAAAIRPALKEESEESLARFDKVMAGEGVPPAGFGGGFGGPRPGGNRPDGDRPGAGGEGPRMGGPGGFMMQPSKPIKGFVTARAKSVQEQLAGKSEGQMVGEFGFGGRGPGGPGGAGGPGGGGPGAFLGGAFVTGLDANKDSRVSREEFLEGFAKWFESWNTDKSGALTEEQLRAGINQDLAPVRGGPGDGPPGGPRQP